MMEDSEFAYTALILREALAAARRKQNSKWRFLARWTESSFAKLAVAIIFAAMLGWGLLLLAAWEERKRGASKVEGPTAATGKEEELITGSVEPAVAALSDIPDAQPSLQSFTAAPVVGFVPWLKMLLSLTVADICDQLGLHPGVLVLLPLAGGLVKTLRRYQPSSEVAKLPLLHRLPRCSISLLTAYHSSGAAAFVANLLLLLATLYHSDWWWLFFVPWFHSNATKDWPAQNPVCPPGDLAYTFHITLGSIQCGRLWARIVARFALLRVLPAAWLGPGSLLLMPYTVSYVFVFARLSMAAVPDPEGPRRLRSYFADSSSRAIARLAYALFWQAPLSLLAALARAAAATPWPQGWRGLLVLPWAFAVQLEGPALLQLAAVVAAYPTWWRCTLKMVHSSSELLIRLTGRDPATEWRVHTKGGKVLPLMLFFLGGPNAQPGVLEDAPESCNPSLIALHEELEAAVLKAVGRSSGYLDRYIETMLSPAEVLADKRLEAWAHVVYKGLLTVAFEPPVLAAHFIKSYPAALLTWLVQSALASFTMVPFTMVGMAFYQVPVLTIYTMCGLATLFGWATAGAQWLARETRVYQRLELATARFVAGLDAAQTQAVVYSRASLGQLKAAYVEHKKRQQQNQRPRGVGGAAQYVDDGLLEQLRKPSGDNRNTATSRSSKGSTSSARPKAASKQKKGSKQRQRPLQQPSTSAPSQPQQGRPVSAATSSCGSPVALDPAPTMQEEVASAIEDWAAEQLSSLGQPMLASHSRSGQTVDSTPGRGSSGSAAAVPAGQHADGTSPATSIAQGHASPQAEVPTATPPADTHLQHIKARQRPQEPGPHARNKVSAQEEGHGPWQTANRRAVSTTQAATTSSTAVPPARSLPLAAASQIANCAAAKVSEVPAPPAAPEGRTGAQGSPPSSVPTPRQVPLLSPTSTQPSAGNQEDECLYCTERPPAAVCIPCGHMVFCEPCAQLLYRRGRTACELCRVELEGWWGPTMGQLAVGAAPAGDAASGNVASVSARH